MRSFLTFVIFVLIPVMGFAAVIHVPADQPTIQAGIDAASFGDTVLVASGTYHEFNIRFNGKAITVKSELGPAVTHIDGDSMDCVFYFVVNEGNDSVLDGFTITNGMGPQGGGITCYGSSPTIMNNMIKKNKSYNPVEGGGGIYINMGASPIILNNIICNNEVDDMSHGGGIFVLNPSSDPILVNNTIFGNTTQYGSGGGLYIHNGPSVSVINTIFWNNTAANGGEICLHTGAIPPDLTISYSDVEGGQADVYVQSGSTLIWGAGMINANPLFANPGTGDFHLPIESPCIDQGDNSAPNLPATDFEGDHRVLLGTVDLGADECAVYLISNTDNIPASTGGMVDFELSAGKGYAHWGYLMLGSVSGTTPGMPLPGGLVLPLNWDHFTILTMKAANTAPCWNFMDILNGYGTSIAQFNTLGSISSSSVGLKIHFAFLLHSPSFALVSNPLEVEIVP